VSDGVRYALYWAPASASPWWHFGAHWLGRDEVRDCLLPQPAIAGLAPARQAELTARPRRYSFHATLKAPFRLRSGCSESDLMRAVRTLAAAHAPLPLAPWSIVHWHGFVALRPQAHSAALDALARAAVLDLEPLRAAPAAAELERRRPACRSPRERALLAQYGYPYVLDRFRFHITLSDRCDPPCAQLLLQAANIACRRIEAGTPLRLDRVALFIEPAPDAPWRRLAEFVLAPS